MSTPRAVAHPDPQDDGSTGPQAQAPIIPLPEPVTLTWEPSALYPGDVVPSSSVLGSSAPEGNQGGRTGDRSLTLDSGARPALPLDMPPAYDVARVPNYPVTYTFSSLGPASGAMILIPPPDLPDTRPLYHISVSHDPFLPHCLITSVMQGGTANGAYIGGFTTIMGIEAVKRQAETVCIRECEHPFYTMFQESTVKRKGMACRTFTWYPFNAKRALKWTTSTMWPAAKPSTCTIISGTKYIEIAEFSTYDQLRRRGDPFKENTLMVMPEGHAHLDDILISALLLERRRRMEMSTNSPWSVRP